MKKLLMVVIILTLTLTGLPQIAAASNPEPRNGTLKVGTAGLDIKIAVILIAGHSDYFAQEGVTVEFEKISNLAEGLTALDMGKPDLFPFGVIPPATFVVKGSDVVVFSGTISEGSEIITKP